MDLFILLNAHLHFTMRHLFSILIIILIIGGDFENLSLKIGICLMFGVSSE